MYRRVPRGTPNVQGATPVYHRCSVVSPTPSNVESLAMCIWEANGVPATHGTGAACRKIGATMLGRVGVPRVYARASVVTDIQRSTLRARSKHAQCTLSARSMHAQCTLNARLMHA